MRLLGSRSTSNWSVPSSSAPEGAAGTGRLCAGCLSVASTSAEAASPVGWVASASGSEDSEESPERRWRSDCLVSSTMAYRVGTRTRVSRVELSSPPITTIASGREMKPPPR